MRQLKEQDLFVSVTPSISQSSLSRMSLDFFLVSNLTQFYEQPQCRPKMHPKKVLEISLKIALPCLLTEYIIYLEWSFKMFLCIRRYQPGVQWYHPSWSKVNLRVRRSDSTKDHGDHS